MGPRKPVTFATTLGIAASVTLTGCGTTFRYDYSPGTTLGIIAVSSPKVSTRERLVNDRNDQDKWLTDRLDDDDKLDFTAAQGLSDLRDASAFSLSAKIQADPTVIATYRESQALALDTVRQTRELQQLQHQKSISDLLNPPAAAATSDPGGTTTSNAASATASDAGSGSNAVTAPNTSSGSQGGTSPTASLSTESKLLEAAKAAKELLANPGGIKKADTVGLSPIDQFRARRDYREEVLSARLKNALDDRHDIQGNALYDLGFDATVIPESDTSAWAKIEVCISGGEGREDLCERGSATSPDAARQDPNDEARLYERWVTALEVYLNRILAARYATTTDPSCEREPVCFLFLSASQQVAIGRYGWDAAREGPSLEDSVRAKQCIFSVFSQADLNAGKRSTGDGASGDTAQPHVPDVTFRLQGGEWFSRAESNKTRPASRPRSVQAPSNTADTRNWGLKDAIRNLLVSVYGKRANDDFTDDQYKLMTQRLLACQLAHEYGEVYGLNTYAKIAVGRPRTGSERNSTTDPYISVTKTIQPRAFADSLTSRSAAMYAHAVTPEQSLERISDVASTSQYTELAVALNLLAGSGVAADTLTNFIRQHQGLYEALRQQPLVVGFAGEAPLNNGRETGRFGWVLGPRYTIKHEKRQSTAQFRQTAVQQALRAAVSLPGWWTETNVHLTTSWVREDGKTQSAGSVIYRVRIPGDVLDATNALANRAYRVPAPDLIGAENDIVLDQPSTNGTKREAASLVIRGDNLWRTTVVTLGNAVSDRVKVLPDMRGIVAYFSQHRLSPGKVPVRVWTSEGSADAGFISVKEPPKEDKGPSPLGFALASTRLIGGDIARLTIASGALPEGYYKLLVRMLPFDANGATPCVEGGTNCVDATPDDGGLTFPVGPSIAGVGDGGRVAITVFLQKTKSAAAEPVVVSRIPVFYRSRATAQIQPTLIRPTPDDVLPATVRLRLPINFALAYPEISSKSIPMKAELLAPMPAAGRKLVLEADVCRPTSENVCDIAIRPDAAVIGDYRKAVKSQDEVVFRVTVNVPNTQLTVAGDLSRKRK